MMTFVELFAGIGMARMGLEKAGMKCVHACEFDKHKRREYEIIHGNLPESEDIRNLRAVDIPKSELWFFGAPCQDFSIAGLRQGLDGERSSLIREVFRLLEEKGEDKPDWIVYENVKGMLSSNGGWDYFSILCKMDELGYDVEWQLLNTKDFGVPQNRERVYTVGHLRRIGERQILPITKTNGKNSDVRIKVVGTKNPNKKIQQHEMIYSDSGIVGCLTATDCNDPKIIQIGKFKNSKRKNPDVYRVFNTKGIAPCLTTMQGGNLQPFIKETEYLIRKLTPKECMRLQGVPDEYTDKLIKAGISDSQIYRAAGDGLTVQIAEEIGKRIKKCMNKYQEALYEVIRLCAQLEETFPTEEIEILQELTDKATPKKPVKRAMPGFDEEIASELCCCGCNMPIVNVWTRKEYKPRYCHYCGQALDWSGKNGD